MSDWEDETSAAETGRDSEARPQNALSLIVPEVKQLVEGALFAAGEPITVERIQGLYEDSERPSREAVLAALQEIRVDYQGHALELLEVAGGWRVQVRASVAPWVGRLWQEKPSRYSRALLETLALIAYRQPITRGEIEQIRGVAVSTPIIKTLSEREWVRVVGHRDVPGRPALYATTRRFLDYFGLRSLNELPPLTEIRDASFFDEALKAADADAGLAPTSGEEEPPRGRPTLVLAASNGAKTPSAGQHDSGDGPVSSDTESDQDADDG